MAETESPNPRLFGTDGVRGIAGKYPLDSTTVRRLGAALVRALPRELGSPRVLIGRDTRESGPWIEAELARIRMILKSKPHLTKATRGTNPIC